MALYITLGSIFLFCVIIALIRIGVIAEYSERGFVVVLKIMAFKINLLPSEQEGKPKKQEKKKPGKEEENKKGGNLDIFLALIPDAKKLLSRFKRKLTIKLIRIDLTAAADNPASAAMMFGGAHAALGIIVPFVENNFNVKKRDIKLRADFTLSSAVIYVKAEVSMAAGSIIAIAVIFAVKFLITASKNKKTKKQEA